MSVTHGGRARRFRWSFRNDQVKIENENGLAHSFPVAEIVAVLSRLQAEFGDQWFPLANNVEKMYDETEIPGLGTTVYRLRPGDISHAQGASYLGVVLEEIGILSWNGKARGIAWRLLTPVPDAPSLRSRLAKHTGSRS